MRSTDEKVGGRRASAFAPAHLTGVFVPALSARDPRARGSLGAGVALEVGAWAQASWSPGPKRRLRVRGDRPGALPISREVAARLLGPRRGELRVALHHDLAIGQGFGMSAAGALATGLAVAEVLDLPVERAVRTAHLAELYGGGGLGGVAAILGGGLELRDRAGVPPWGRIRHRPWAGRIYLVTLGRALPSPSLLRDPEFLHRVELAGRASLARVRRSFTAPRVFQESEAFTDRLGLAPPSWGRILRGLRGPEIRVGQAMLGRSLFAVPLTAPAEQELLRRLRPLKRSVVRVRGGLRGAGLVAASSRAGSGPRSKSGWIDRPPPTWESRRAEASF